MVCKIHEYACQLWHSVIISVTALLCTNMCQTTNTPYTKKLSEHMEPENRMGVKSLFKNLLGQKKLRRTMMAETGTSVVYVCSSENGAVWWNTGLNLLPFHHMQSVSSVWYDVPFNLTCSHVGPFPHLMPVIPHLIYTDGSPSSELM